MAKTSHLGYAKKLRAKELPHLLRLKKKTSSPLREIEKQKSHAVTLWRTEKDLWGWFGGAQTTGFGANFA